jgi:hypothetical protein
MAHTPTTEKIVKVMRRQSQLIAETKEKMPGRNDMEMVGLLSKMESNVQQVSLCVCVCVRMRMYVCGIHLNIHSLYVYMCVCDHIQSAPLALCLQQLPALRTLSIEQHNEIVWNDEVESIGYV